MRRARDPERMGFVGNAVAFAASALVGGFGIYVGGRLLTGERRYGAAVWTALVGALVWGVASALVGWVPFVGPALVLVAYVGVIERRYPGGWVAAGAIALAAWLASFLVLGALAAVGVTSLSAVGIPEL